MKRTSLRILTCAMLVLTLLTGLAGFASAETPEVEVIRVWSDNAHEKELRDEQVARFNSTIGKEKGIEIEYTVHGTNWQDTINIAAQAGEAPELFRPNGTFLQKFVDAGYLIPITSLPGGDEFVAPYDGQLVVNQHIFGGEIYTLPYNLTTQKFAINQDLFDKNGIEDIPHTWAEVREYAKIITDNGDGVEYGYILGLQSDWTLNSYLMRETAVSTGHVGFDNDTLQFNFSAALPAIEAIMGMIEDGSVLPGSAGLDADAMRAQFAEGRVGMIPAVSFDVGVYNDQFPAKCNWRVISIPTFTDGPSPYKEFVDATSLLGVGAAAADKPEKTLEVLRYFYSDECMAEMYERSLYIPYRQEAMALATSEPTQKGFAEFADVPDKVLMLPMPDNIIPLEGTSFRATLANLMSGALGTDAAAVLADLDARYNTALATVDPELLEAYRTPEGRNIMAE
ncbi:extracellular solute-binding protein [Eubacteriales bacterium OttesenSCG-928-A19]|nr:extracellular solute-binding protein [Eubacteriales bacterium OttesenSCG-928-A19]